MFDVRRAVETEGMTHEPELLWLAEQASKHDRIVEIGTYCGRSTRALGDHARGFVVTVDTFQGLPPHSKPLQWQDIPTLKARAHRNLSDLLESGKVVILEADYETVEVDFQPDMVFLDGLEGYDTRFRCITKWMDRLPSGGLLCGHPAASGPTQDAFLAITGKPLQIAPGTNLWYWVKP